MQELNAHKKGAPERDLTLYECHAPTLYTYIYRRVSHLQDAEDILLEVFTIALGETRLVDLSARQQIAWLQSVARRKIIDRYRHTSHVVLLPLAHALDAVDGDLPPEEQVLQKERYGYLYTAIARLPPFQQEIIRLRYGDGLRFAEIATLLNKSEGTVRKMLFRILHQLRAIYARQ